MSSLPLLFETKVCVECKAHQPLNAFPHNARGEGYQLKCRTCQPRYRRGGRPELAKRRAWQRKNPEKRVAHKAVEYAIARGDLVRPKICETCGASGRIEADHRDYSNFLNVQWLCCGCHRVLARQRSPGGRRATVWKLA